MFIIRLDVDEISAKTQKPQLLNTKFLTKSSFPTEAKIGGDIRTVAEDPTRRLILVSVPNSPPIKRYRQNTISMHSKQK